MRALLSVDNTGPSVNLTMSEKLHNRKKKVVEDENAIEEFDADEVDDSNTPTTEDAPVSRYNSRHSSHKQSKYKI